MKTNRKTTILLALLAAVSAAVCAPSLYYLNKPYEIKNYRAGIGRLLADIFNKSAAKSFAGDIAELKRLSGPREDKDLEEAVLKEITDQLFWNEQSPYNAIIEPSEYEASIIALKTYLETRRVPPNKIAGIVKKKTRKAKKTADYAAELSWFWEDEENGYLRLVFKISATGFIEATAVITHPAYEKWFLDRRRRLTAAAWAGGALLAGALLMLVWLAAVFRLKAKKAYAAIPALREMVEKFMNEGQFTAAMNEIGKYLNLLPDDSEVLALKSQLLVKTKAAPAKAEEAYNKLRFIKGKLEGRGMDKIDQKDLEDLRDISESLVVEGLGAIIGRVEGHLHSRLAGAQITAAKAQAQMLIESGRPDEAVKELEKAQRDPSMREYSGALAGMEENARLALPAPDSLKSLRGEAEEAIRAGRSGLAEAKVLLTRGEVTPAEELLIKAVKANRALSEAEELLARIEKSRKTDKLVLVPEKIGKKVFILKKDVITLFRRDLKEPDIELNFKTVSRDAHLKIAVVGDKVLAEDQNSSAGTKIGGQEVKSGAKYEIGDGDILDFGAYKLTAHICRGGGVCAAPTVAGATIAAPIMQRNIPESRNIGAVVFEGEDDRNFIVLLENAPAAFRSIGLVYEKAGDCSFCVRDGATMLLTPDRAEILYPGAKVEYKGIRYKC